MASGKDPGMISRPAQVRAAAAAVGTDLPKVTSYAPCRSTADR
jgi:hypothetical protein